MSSPEATTLLMDTSTASSACSSEMKDVFPQAAKVEQPAWSGDGTQAGCSPKRRSRRTEIETKKVEVSGEPSDTSNSFQGNSFGVPNMQDANLLAKGGGYQMFPCSVILEDSQGRMKVESAVSPIYNEMPKKQDMKKGPKANKVSDVPTNYTYAVEFQHGGSMFFGDLWPKPPGEQGINPKFQNNKAFTEYNNCDNLYNGSAFAPIKHELNNSSGTENKIECSICYDIPVSDCQNCGASTCRCPNNSSSSSSSNKNKLPRLKDKSSHCSICHKSFADAAHLKIHMRKHTGEKPYACGYCGRAFSVLFNLKRHERTHGEKKLIVCSVCKRSFSTSSHLMKHMQTHITEYPYHYAIFDGSFVKSYKLKTDKSVKCGICLRLFSDMAHLKIHMRTHTKEKPYFCKYCSKPFSVIFNLKRHEKTHFKKKSMDLSSSERVYPCSSNSINQLNPRTLRTDSFHCAVCSKSYHDYNLLQKHQERHSKEELTVCKICSKTFRDSTHLKIHMRTHTGERPYKCRFCNKAFAVFFNAKRHERTHSKEKPYVCTICDKAFVNSSYLAKHVKTHGVDRPYAQPLKPVLQLREYPDNRAKDNPVNLVYGGYMYSGGHQKCQGTQT